MSEFFNKESICNMESQYLGLLYCIKDTDGGVSKRETRSGTVYSVFDTSLECYENEGFPLFTTKKVQFSSIVGELLWFLSGKCDLPSLRHYSDIEVGKWTIWTNDYKDFLERLKGAGDNMCYAYSYSYNYEHLGFLYGNQWRHFGNRTINPFGFDQIENLIKNLKEDPYSRRHIVTSYDPSLTNTEIALPPCHTMFQCYVSEDKKLSLKYSMRSNDLFLGCPFNIASYALLQRILCKLTGYELGTLTADLGDAHIYESHFEAVETQLDRTQLPFCEVNLPDFNTLDELLEYTAKDFKLVNYQSHEAIKAPLQTQVK